MLLSVIHDLISTNTFFSHLCVDYKYNLLFKKIYKWIPITVHECWKLEFYFSENKNLSPK